MAVYVNIYVYRNVVMLIFILGFVTVHINVFNDIFAIYFVSVNVLGTLFT